MTEYDAPHRTETQKPPMLAADYIRELVKHHSTSDRIDRFVPIPNVGELPKWDRTTERVTVMHPSLIEQLEEAVQQSRDGGSYGGGSAKSKPSARLDAIETIAFIERDSRKRAKELDIDPAPLVPRLLAIAGKLGTDPDPRVKAWWIKARVSTGWEKAPYEPDVPCPNSDCERRGTLRIRLDQYIATCTSCGATWDDDNYNTLGEYIRWAFEHLRGSRHWVYDAEGYPTECIECLVDRQLMAERKVSRKKADATPA